MTAAASTSDILRAVERWARVRGFAFGGTPHEGQAWQVSIDAARTEATIWRHDGKPTPPWTVSPAIALAWAILVESEAAPVDVGRCQACVKRGGPMEWKVIRWHPHDSFFHCSRPCPACSGTGRETIPAERFLLDAGADGACPTCADAGCVGPLNARGDCPDCTPRRALRAHADQLQAAGDQLGSLLAWALYLWTGEPTDHGECPDCKGRGVVPGDPPSWANPYGEPPEDCGCGDGRLFGHPHTAEAVAWLERLTRERESFAPVPLPAGWTWDVLGHRR